MNVFTAITQVNLGGALLLNNNVEYKLHEVKNDDNGNK